MQALNAVARSSVMYQVEVTTREGAQKRVGPMSSTRDMAEALCQTINLAVASGKERSWYDAHVIEVHHVRS